MNSAAFLVASHMRTKAVSSNSPSQKDLTDFGSGEALMEIDPPGDLVPAKKWLKAQRQLLLDARL